MKKRVLILSSSASMHRGGQQSILLHLKSLNRALYEPVLFCMEEGEFPQIARDLGIEVIIQPLPSMRTCNPFTIFRCIRKLRHQLCGWNIHIVHSEFSRANFYFGMAVRGTNIPLIWHVRISNAENFLYERVLYGLTHKIIAVSSASALRFARFPRFEDKIAIAHNAVDPKRFNPEKQDGSFRKELHAEGKILCGIIGEVMPLKGQMFFIEAAIPVCNRYKNVHFVMIGDTRDKQYAHSLKSIIADYGLSDRFSFVPFRSDIASVLLDLDVVVNASLNEGFSRTIIEAMACGKPVIATRVGGNSEAVNHEETGFLVPLNDVQALTKAYELLLSDQGRRYSMGRSARKRVAENFTPEQTSRKVEKVYEEVAFRVRPLI